MTVLYTIEQAYDDFIGYMLLEKQASPNTIETYQYVMKSYRNFLCKHNLSTDIVCHTGTEAHNYIVSLYERVYSSASIAKNISALRAFYQFLFIEKRISHNFMKDIDMVSVCNKLPEVLQIDEIDRLFMDIDVSSYDGLCDRAVFELLYSCGLRISECVNLNCENVYWDESMLLIFKSKGGKSRWVPIGEEGLYWLSRYMNDARPYLLKNHSVEALFLSTRGKRINRKNMWKHFNLLVQNSIIPVQASLHTLRHSFATHMLQGGSDIRMVQELLGHSSLITTQIYTQIDTHNLRQAHKAYVQQA